MSEITTESHRPASTETSYNYQYIDEQGATSHVSVTEFKMMGAEIFAAESHQEQAVKMQENQQSPVLNLFFSLEGSCGAYHHNRHKNYLVKGMQHTVCYTPEFDGYYSIETPVIRNFGISLNESFFQKLFINDQEYLKSFWDKVHAGKVADLTPAAMPITPAQLDIIRDMQHCAFTSQMKQMYLETKIVELFLLQAEQAGSLKRIKPASLQPPDIEKLHAARTFIKDHLFEPLTLMQVARNCSLNDFKLKKGFKELFGTTVFGYLNELRMNYGKQMLLDTSCTIYEAAHMLGYADPYSFSKAFKKHFGYLPGKLKNIKW